jgi:hypothetical protein
MRLTLNGRRSRLGGGRRQPARPAARGLRPALDEGRLRARGLVRRVHGHRRRPGRRLLRPAGARFADREVLTLEGLPAAARAAWADAFVASGASQCGYCSPGIVMKAEALLARDPRPTDARSPARWPATCAAAPATSRSSRPSSAWPRRRAVARPPPAGGRRRRRPAPRYEGREQVLGEQPFVGDLVLPGMLHGASASATIRGRSCGASTRRRGGASRRRARRDLARRPRRAVLRPDHARLAGPRRRGRGDALRRRHARRGGRRDARGGPRGRGADRGRVRGQAAGHRSGRGARPDAPPIHPGGNLLSTSVVRRGDVDARWPARRTW